MQPAPPAAPAPLHLSQVPFGGLAGWADSDPQQALMGFRRSCGVLGPKPDTSSLGGLYAGTVADWRTACGAASNASSARDFFEANFVPYRVSQTSDKGLFTGYYEPQLKGSRTRHDAFQTPLYGVPADLVTIELGLFRDALKGQRIEGRVMGNRVVPYSARAEIARAGLPSAMTLLYVDDAVDAFFLQIQGSGRVVLDDGSVVRALYAGENGQPYTAIGAVLIQRGELKREEVSLQTIRAWLYAHPGQAQELMDHDASYVFFGEQPIALKACRSLPKQVSRSTCPSTHWACRYSSRQPRLTKPVVPTFSIGSSSCRTPAGPSKARCGVTSIGVMASAPKRSRGG